MLNLALSILISCGTTSKDTKSLEINESEDEIDIDGDGFISSEDCDDSDPYINSSAIEICDGLDNDCDGHVDEGVLNTYYVDADGDGFGNTELTVEACEPSTDYVVVANDCDDTDPQKYPGSDILCDDIKTSFCSSGGRVSGSSFSGKFCLSPVNTVSSTGSASGTSYIWQPGTVTLLSE